MHLLVGDQDSRRFGSLGFSYFSKLLFSMRVLSLIGFPFSLGFYSKDRVIGAISIFDFNLYSFLFFLGCSLTVAYRIRLIYIAFNNQPSYGRSSFFTEDEYFFIPIILLYSLCVFLGNFFFFYFLPPVVFSFLDLFFGVIIILSGYLVFSFSISSYFVSFILMTISFLSLFFPSFFSRKNPLLPSSIDAS
jgi:hypothetical protein